MTDMNGDVPEIFGRIPYRMAFAGGWIDQPFVNRLNPDSDWIGRLGRSEIPQTRK